MKEKDIIKARNLDFFYGRAQALRHVTAAIPAGRVTALIGPSGCGKSTFLRTLNRMSDLVEGTRVEGSLTFHGEEVFSPNVDVTGLLAGADMVQAIQDHDGGGECIYLVPQVAFNDDGLTVDGMTFKDIAEKSGKAVEVVPSNPLDCIERLKRMSEETNPWHCR